MADPPLPQGFTLDQDTPAQPAAPATPPPPTGFTLDAPAAPDEDAIKTELTQRLQAGQDPAQIVHWLVSINRPPDKQTMAAIIQNQGNQNPEVHESIFRQLLDNTKNDLAGVAQGVAAIPDMAATAAGKIMSAIPTAVGAGLDELGFHNAADTAHGVAHDLANPPTVGGAVESAVPTPDTTSGHVNRFIGQMLGGAIGMPTSALESAAAKIAGEVPKGFVPSPASAAEAPPDYAQLARELKVRRTPATASRTGITTGVQGALETLPGGDSMVTAAKAREADDLATAARGVAQSVGQVSDRQGAGMAIAQGAEDYKTTSKQDANTLYGQRDALIGGSDTPVPTDRTKLALDDIASRFPTSPAIQQLREHPAIRAIGGALPGEPAVENVPTGILDANGNPITRAVASGGEPLTLGETTEALSHVRGVVRNLSTQTLNGKATGPVLARVKQVEQGLEDDVMAAAQKADLAAGRVPGAVGSATKAQQDADAFYADRAQALNGSLKKPLASAADDTKVSGEAVYNQVASDMDGQNGNLARLRDTWFRLPPEAKSTFAATKIDDLGRSTPGQQNDLNTAWSFQRFLTNLNSLSPQARNIVFGAQADDQLQKIATYANRLRDLDRSRNFSNTAKRAFSAVYMGAVVGSLMHGDVSGAIEAGASAPAFAGMAKFLLATPAMRDWTAQAMKAVTTGNETALRVLTARLGTIASAHPVIARQARGLQSAIIGAANDNLHSLAASTGQQQPQSQNNQASPAR